MRVNEIRDRTDEELQTLAGQISEDLYHLRVNKATNQLENTDTLRIKRRELARVRTIQRARALGKEQTTRTKQESEE